MGLDSSDENFTPCLPLDVSLREGRSSRLLRRCVFVFLGEKFVNWRTEHLLIAVCLRAVSMTFKLIKEFRNRKSARHLARSRGI